MNAEFMRRCADTALVQQPYPNPLFPPSPYYRFLRILATETKPKLSVVLGVCGGGCCLHLALGHTAGRVIGVDYAYDHPEQLSHIKSECANFTFWHGDSTQAAFEIFKDFGYVDILFIDTVHIRDATIREFEVWRQYLSKTAVVCFDDLLRVEMGDFWDWLPGPNKVRLDDMHPSAEGGFGVWWNE